MWKNPVDLVKHLFQQQCLACVFPISTSALTQIACFFQEETTPCMGELWLDLIYFFSMNTLPCLVWLTIFGRDDDPQPLFSHLKQPPKTTLLGNGVKIQEFSDAAAFALKKFWLICLFFQFYDSIDITSSNDHLYTFLHTLQYFFYKT